MESIKPALVRIHDVKLDDDYIQWIQDVKQRFRKKQIKAAVKVNSEQLLFNWQLGRDLVIRKAEEKWGSGIVEQVSLDLQAAFPDVKGFSARNLWNMKKWYSFYAVPESTALLSDLNQIVEHDQEKLQQVAAEIPSEKLQQVVAEYPFPIAFGYVPWGHHLEIITKCSSIAEALFYIQRTIEAGWSRSALENSMQADIYHKTGTAVTNFDERLPAPQSKLAQELLKENYDLRFIALPDEYGQRRVFLYDP